MQAHPELFADQLRAILLAARQIEPGCCFAMVTSPEVVWARRVLDRVRLDMAAPELPVGVMVEVPAAAIRAADFASLVDFIGVGTNDLSQYTQGRRPNQCRRSRAGQTGRASGAGPHPR